jgi:hypothetical protein
MIMTKLLKYKYIKQYSNNEFPMCPGSRQVKYTKEGSIFKECSPCNMKAPDKVTFLFSGDGNAQSDLAITRTSIIRKKPLSFR